MSADLPDPGDDEKLLENSYVEDDWDLHDLALEHLLSDGRGTPGATRSHLSRKG